jgi:hypothetical protein
MLKFLAVEHNKLKYKLFPSNGICSIYKSYVKTLRYFHNVQNSTGNYNQFLLQLHMLNIMPANELATLALCLYH